MKRLTIEIEGKQYPCYQTMGASLRLKDAEGLEVSEIKETDFTAFCKYLYYCVVSACSKEKIPFDMSLMDFADNVSLEDVTAWGQSLAEAVDPKARGEKKRK